MRGSELCVQRGGNKTGLSRYRGHTVRTVDAVCALPRSYLTLQQNVRGLIIHNVSCNDTHSSAAETNTFC